MNVNNIKCLVIDALIKTLNLKDTLNVDEDHHLKNDLGLDSMSSLVFLMKLEENIPGFQIDPDTLGSDSLETVQSITHYIENQLELKLQVA